MLNKVNHIALAVPDIKKACANYQNQLGVKVEDIQTLHEHGVHVAFIETQNTKIELLEPIDDTSSIAKFLEKNPNGGMHHICYEVSDIAKAKDKLLSGGARLLGDGIPRKGAHGRPVLFLHPHDFHGCLIELEEVK